MQLGSMNSKKTFFTIPLHLFFLLGMKSFRNPILVEAQDCTKNTLISSCTVGEDHPGYDCGGQCLAKEHWCQVTRTSLVPGSVCTNRKNLRFSSCMQAKFTLETNGDSEKIDYLYARVGHTDWDVAENFCQSKGYNLLSLASQAEYDKIVDFLSKNLEGSTDIQIDDPLGQRCTDKWEPLGKTADYYWLGLFYNYSSSQWQYTDRETLVNLTIKSKTNSLNDGVKDVARMCAADCKTGRIIFSTLNDRFTGIRISVPNARKFGYSGNSNHNPGIICKKRSSNQEIINNANQQDCFTGFNCGQSCLKGPMFRGSKVCNGVKDCEDGSDESVENCPFLEIKPKEDKYRKFLFLPYRRDFSVAKAICSQKRMTFPSVHSLNDIRSLSRDLPKLAASHFASDIRFMTKDWADQRWDVMLDIDKDSRKWSDGSTADEKEKIPGLDLVLNTDTSAGEIVLSSKGGKLQRVENPQSFVVCQSGTYKPKKLGTSNSGKTNQTKGSVKLSSSSISVLFLHVLLIAFLAVFGVNYI